ncbi:MAG: spore germination protein [Bacilli bacterium]|nr:spore germination protein [Bacilli bacterium]
MEKLVKSIQNKTGKSKDYKYQKIKVENKTIHILFNEVLVDTETVNDDILKRLTLIKETELNTLENIIPNCNIQKLKYDPNQSKEDQILYYINQGFLVILEENITYIIEVRSKLSRSISEVNSELSIKGPKDAFNENFNTNLGLIRKRIKSERLICEDQEFGTLTKTKVGILYISDIADNSLVEKVRLKLSTINIDGIIDSTYLKENLESKNSSFFPTIMTTERPDKVSMALLEGKVAIIVDMSPYVLILPNFFIDFFHTVDDYYQKPINISFIRIVRLLAFLISIFTPALYIMITTHNYNFIGLDLLLSLKAQRESVPFPALIEALFMTLSFEILRESDIRMSSTSGNAVSILGGLILGDAAVSAGIISPIMIIVIAISAISGLTFTSIELVSAIRWWRLIMLILATMFGLEGIVLGTFILFVRLVTIKSFGMHYLTPFFPLIKSELKDSFIKTENKGEKYRNPLLAKNNQKRGHFR